VGVDPAAAARLHGLLQQLGAITSTDDDGLVEFVDERIEQVDLLLDEAAGVNAFAGGSTGGAAAVTWNDPHQLRRAPRAEIFQDEVAEKPQKRFADAVDNDAEAPFVPPRVPGLPVEQGVPSGFSPQGRNRAHPFASALGALKPPARLLKKSSPKRPGGLEAYKYAFVDSEKALKAMAKALKGAKEVAIDLEAHSFRSFQGFTCLMQLSTRTHDWVVDLLACRDYVGQHLSALFHNPKCVKVMHGADSDVVWLQRDFGLYIVNLFGTGQCARVLEFESFGLAHVLKKYVDVDAQKQYQLADWRVRPLSAELLAYAREDTHYLLYCAELLKNELLEKGGKPLLLEALRRSNDVSLKLYSKARYDSNTYKLDLRRLNKGSLSTGEAAERVFAAVHAWRDGTARKFDESLHYVLPTRLMLRIAEQLPMSELSLGELALPLPPLVQHYSKQLVLLVQQAVAASSDGAATPGASPGRKKRKQPDASDLISGELSSSECYRLGGWGAEVEFAPTSGDSERRGAEWWAGGDSSAMFDVEGEVAGKGMVRSESGTFSVPEDAKSIATARPATWSGGGAASGSAVQKVLSQFKASDLDPQPLPEQPSKSVAEAELGLGDALEAAEAKEAAGGHNDGQPEILTLESVVAREQGALPKPMAEEFGVDSSTGIGGKPHKKRKRGKKKKAPANAPVVTDKKLDVFREGEANEPIFEAKGRGPGKGSRLDRYGASSGHHNASKG